MRDSWTGLRIVHEEGGRVTVTFPEGPTGVGSSTEEAISRALAQKATPTEAKEKGGEKK
ncbi:MAG: hypothetical protein UV76_C0001G0029 [Candidatus Nomurabacteria bacterium GW2011_GWA2_43_15]|uniref:Uncharacterized protein n=2 Tax=Candidatus Nomuraibacteriota TaxID=1752729 RepID=A0A0G1DTQ4_9BACT|nr:MAG: hypothetical protein UV76_C0001G0029 [Candidatus Nomurabacteria bacterium GW2011_GWA2_43_15]KKT19226.1 MAG: hypothetical protein UW02_C0013G0009 [Candidatus Nomurabacteria bacterium GW2011_GWB1_43_7]